jgi:hypothetical protein
MIKRTAEGIDILSYCCSKRWLKCVNYVVIWEVGVLDSVKCVIIGNCVCVSDLVDVPMQFSYNVAGILQSILPWYN